jgi:DNA-binding transcriptional LysR family regulator
LALTKLARSALAELDQVRVQMESFSSGVRGLVRVCASMSAITQFLSEPLRSFLDEHPNVQVQLEERLSPMVVKAVAENAADVGIFLPLVAMPPNLEQHGYHSDRLALITPKGHPLSLRKAVTLPDLLAHDLIGLHTGSAINILLNRAAQEARREVNIKIQVTSFDALCTMVSTGLGIALLPESMARRNARTVPLHICRLDEPWARRQFALCVRSRTTLPAAAQLLMDHLLAPLQAGSEKERQP